MIKVYNLIGLAYKAGKISSGAMAVKTSMGSKRARLLIFSDDAAQNTRQVLESLCRKYAVPYCTLGDKNQLGASIGKAYRVAVTINDSGFAEAILRAVKGEKTVEVVEWPN